jgi:hypothetical protein
MITKPFHAKWYGVLAGILLLGAIGAIGAAAVRAPSTVANPAASDSSSVRADDLLHDPNSPVLGNPRGAVTVVEFFDYRCPHLPDHGAAAPRIGDAGQERAAGPEGLADLRRHVGVRSPGCDRGGLARQIRASS